MEEGHKITADKKDGITVQKGGRIIKYDIRLKTPKGVLWCTYIKWPEPEGKVAAGMSKNQSVKRVKELTSVIKMNIERAHVILGHASMDAIWQTALGMLITRGTLKTCEPCAIAKAKQQNLNNKSEGAKADKINGWVYHNIETVKKSNEDKKLGCKTVWCITTKETINFK
jgi:hypothetical protein